MKIVKKKILSIILIIITLLSVFQNIVMALDIDKADIKSGEDCRLSSTILE